MECFVPTKKSVKRRTVGCQNKSSSLRYVHFIGIIGHIIENHISKHFDAVVSNDDALGFLS